MKVEIQVALNFVISYLYNKLPRRRVNIFADEMQKGLREKFDGHWYPQKPYKGSGYRCLRVSGQKLDPVIETAAAASGLNMDEIRNNMPDELSIWIDPSEVSYRCGEKSAVKVLYVEDKDDTLNNLDQSITEVKSSFNPEADSFRPIDSVSSSLSSMSLSPTSPVPPSFTSPSPTSMFGKVSPAADKPQLVTFDAATFAQTKFGSTKMKTASKKINLQRLSPTEFTTYMKQRSALNGMYAQRPRSLSPNAKEFMYPQTKVDNMSIWGGDGLSLQSTNVGYETLPNTNTNNDATKALFDGLNFNVPYNGQYNQQSLVAAN
ncbi:protein Tob1-like [Saccoglossus kowalevskii]|uniref:Protein Tob1-like n=1 Tax=Saccoglossus kowalevskii TaxID=10224 RepID=A0ABM0GSL8_SACKO|nr:PREDICTED: protein Tob1-like [Saccoglossus kowalevskii]